MPRKAKDGGSVQVKSLADTTGLYLKRGGPVAKMFVREQLAKAEQRQKQLTELQQRVAYELNWTMPDVQSVSLQSLRDILNDGKHKKLCDEVTRAIQSGEYIKR